MCNLKLVFSLIWITCSVQFSASLDITEWHFEREKPVCPDVNSHCINIESCQEFTDQQASERTNFHTFLRIVGCGYDDKTPKVCCPKDCQIDGMQGSCKDEKDCPGLRRFDEEKPKRDIFFNSKCKEKKICCPKSPLTCVATSLPNPCRECCGIVVATDKISGGSPTDIDEYPWTVLVQYKNGRNKICGGSLISGRYVLTAAHCVHKDFSGEIDHVIVGEYDTNHTGPDCVGKGSREYCTEGVTRIKVSKAIIHPDYSLNKYKNDIAVLQLAKMARFTDFVQPVCLPSAKAFVNYQKPMFIVGWGGVNINISRSNVKRHAAVYQMDNKKCSSTFRTKLNKKILCAKGLNGEGPCAGDSGGPLMRLSGKNLELAGIHSHGTAACGINYPGVYTNVAEYLDWINDTMKGEEENYNHRRTPTAEHRPSSKVYRIPNLERGP